MRRLPFSTAKSLAKHKAIQALVAARRSAKSPKPMPTDAQTDIARPEPAKEPT